MSAKLEQSRAEREPEEVSPLEAVIRDNVLAGLGRPQGPYRVQVKTLWPGRYRVNVFVTDDAGYYRIAQSYFLEADADGKVLTSKPPIAREY